MISHHDWASDEGVVYGLVDPRDGRIRYVGQTISPGPRLSAHLSEVREGCNSPKAAWIRTVLDFGERPFMVILERCRRYQLKNAERRHIASVYRVVGDALTNIGPVEDYSGRSVTAEDFAAVAAEFDHPDPAVRYIQRFARAMAHGTPKPSVIVFATNGRKRQEKEGPKVIDQSLGQLWIRSAYRESSRVRGGGT